MRRQTLIAATGLCPSAHMRSQEIGLLGQSTKPVKPFSTMDRDESLILPR